MESKVVEKLKMKAIVTITNEKRLDEVIVVGLGPRRWRRHLRYLGKAPSLGRASATDRQKKPTATVSSRRIWPSGTRAGSEGRPR